MDPAFTPRSARKALDRHFAHRRRHPVMAVICTRSHFGGVGAATTVEGIAAGRTTVIARAGFTEEAVSGNLDAGSAMLGRTM